MDTWMQIVGGVLIVGVAAWSLGGLVWHMFQDLVVQPPLHRRARAELPRLAAQLGLTHRAPRQVEEIGTFDGVYRGYAVELKPDDRHAKLVLTLPQVPSPISGEALDAPLGLLPLAPPEFRRAWAKRLRRFNLAGATLLCNPVRGTPDWEGSHTRHFLLAEDALALLSASADVADRLSAREVTGRSGP